MTLLVVFVVVILVPWLWSSRQFSRDVEFQIKRGGKQ